MNWNNLRVFYLAAKQGNLSQVAQKLKKTQSAISRTIINLEKELNTKLFTRSSNGVILTNEGETWYNSVKKFAEDIEKTKKESKNDTKLLQGNIKIYTIPIISSYGLVKYIKKFTDLYPNVKFQIMIDFLDKDIVFEKDIVAIYPRKFNSSNLIQDAIGKFHLGLYASKSYLKKFGTPNKPEDLDKHKLISYGGISLSLDTDKILTLGKKDGKIREPYMQVTLQSDRVFLAQQGAGITTLVEEVGSKEGLVRVLPTINFSVDIYYTYPNYLDCYKRIKLLNDFLKNEIKKEYQYI